MISLSKELTVHFAFKVWNSCTLLLHFEFRTNRVLVCIICHRKSLFHAFRTLPSCFTSSLDPWTGSSLRIKHDKKKICHSAFSLKNVHILKTTYSESISILNKWRSFQVIVFMPKELLLLRDRHELLGEKHLAHYEWFGYHLLIGTDHLCR